MMLDTQVAAGSYGTVAVFSSTVKMHDVTVANCSADMVGGLALVGTTATFADVVVEGNEATGVVGGAVLNFCHVNTTGGLTVSNNVAGADVGGLAIEGLFPGSVMDNTVLSGNRFVWVAVGVVGDGGGRKEVLRCQGWLLPSLETCAPT